MVKKIYGTIKYVKTVDITILAVLYLNTLQLLENLF